MPTVNCKIEKGIPVCPKCKEKYNGNVVDYGALDGNTFWFSFLCSTCSGKKGKVKVKYKTDGNFKVKG